MHFTPLFGQFAVIVLLLLALPGCIFSGSKTYVIAGWVTDEQNAGMENVVISFSGGFAETTTDATGAWSQVVKGEVTVTPLLAGYQFTPPTRQVQSATSTANFTASAIQHTYVTLEPTVQTVFGSPGFHETNYQFFSNSSNAYKSAGNLRVEFSDGETAIDIPVPVGLGEATIYGAERVVTALNDHPDFTNYVATLNSPSAPTAILVINRVAEADKNVLFRVTDPDDTGMMFDSYGESQAGVPPVAAVGTTTVLSGSSVAETFELNLNTSRVNTDISVSVLAGDSASDVAVRIGNALATNTVVSTVYDVDTSGEDVILTQKPGYEASDNIRLTRRPKE